MPVTAEGFFDREKELSALEEVVERLEKGAPRWLAILGARKIGKSSLVIQLAIAAATGQSRFEKNRTRASVGGNSRPSTSAAPVARSASVSR